MLHFRLFCKIISKPFLKFSRVWTKNTIVCGKFEKILKFFYENSMEKLNLYLSLGKYVAKNRNIGNSIIFLQQFFPVRGGGLNPPTPPLRAQPVSRLNLAPKPNSQHIKQNNHTAIPYRIHRVHNAIHVGMILMHFLIKLMLGHHFL